MSQKLDVAVLGATGTVGQRFIQLLAAHPWFRVAEVAASDRSAGKRYAEATRWVLPGEPPTEIANLTVLPLDAAFKSPIVMSALPGDVAKTLEPTLAAAGHLVSSNTSANRMQTDVPLLLPEINADHVRLVDAQRRKGWAGALVTMSNCTIVGTVVALAPLREFGIERISLVSMQAISGSGYPGVASFDILDNVLPYIGGEEEKVETEPQKILGALTQDKIVHLETRISAACNRVPVMDGHTVCVSVGFKHKPTLAQIREAWENYQGHDLARELPSLPKPVITYSEGADRPQPRRDRDAGGGMTTTIGRLRECSLLDYKFVTLSHNTVRGAAGGAILNAELLVAQGYASHVMDTLEGAQTR
ncbi:MAG: aspartate-semialdehyde dehydrogenase [Anaerolinea sp.]|nr:aspartate-semialdehyde dehydrogenase [Anaerolinea sp.]